jgi:hypothetical protein
MRIVQSFLLGIFLLMACNTITAQKGFGVRAGINISGVSKGNIPNTDNLTGFYLGAYKEIPLVKSLLFIQPELQFSKQGFSTKTTDFNLNYLTVPVLAKVYLAKMFSFEAGPQFGVKISDTTDDSGYNFKTFDTAMAVGMSFNLPLGLAINGRYIGGFGEVIKNSDAKNQVIQLGASFTF